MLLTASPSDAAISQCQDGFDNDGDGRTDYPNDTDCASIDDNDEYSGGGGMFVSISDGKDRLAPGASVIYAVTVSTNDPSPQSGTVTVSVPTEVGIISASNGGELVTPSLARWRDVTVSRNAPVTYTIQGTVNPRAAEGISLVTRASIGGREATDTTLVRSTGILSATNPSFSVSITDGLKSVLPGGDLDYDIVVQNILDVSMTTDVRATLSPYLTFVSPDGSTDQDSSRILWAAQNFGPRESRTYHFYARALERARRNELIRVSASVAGAVDTDNTQVRSAITPHNFDISISDGRGNAMIGEQLNYTVTIHNNEDGTVSDAYVTAAMPIYSEFVGASAGGTRDSSVIRWPRIEVPAHGDRVLNFSIRVRPDAPIGADLLASAALDGMTDYDHTEVVNYSTNTPSTSSSRRGIFDRVSNTPILVAPVPTSSASPRSSTSTYRPAYRSTASSVARPSERVLLQKTADHTQVLAGGVVRFRLIVNNITDAQLSGLTVNDRFNASQFSVVDASGAKDSGAGTLEWSIPTLQPGDTWSVTYTLRAANDLPMGTMISNLAALNGNGLDAIALDRRLSATKIAVVSTLPTTGAPLDMLGLVFLGLLPAVPAALQRRSVR